VSHVVSDSGCAIPYCVLFGLLLCLVCPMLSVTLDVPFRVVYCLPSSYGMEHPESLTTWDTQDTEGRQINTTRNGPSRITDNIGHTRHRRKPNKTQHGMEHPQFLCFPCCQRFWMVHSVLCFVCLPSVSCVSHVVSDSGCSIPCCIQSYWQQGTHKTQYEAKQYTTRNGPSRFTDNMGHTRHRRKANKTQHRMKHPESLTTWDTHMLSAILDGPFRVVFCLPSFCVLCVPCCQ
jgi:hypothetical protein